MSKLALPLLFVLFAGDSSGQLTLNSECSPVNITININGQMTDSMSLVVSGGCEGSGITSFMPKNGIFKYTGLIDRACEVIIFTDTKNPVALDGPSVIRFIAEPGNMSISFSMENNLPAGVVITGSKAETEKENWEKKYAPVFAIENRAYGELGELNKKIHGDSASGLLKKKSIVWNKIEAIKEIKASLAQDFIHHHPSSYFSAYLLFLYTRIMSPDSVAGSFLKLTPQVANSQIGMNAMNKILNYSDNWDFIKRYADSSFASKWIESKSVYDLAATDTGGHQIHFSDFKGKYLFVDFWATWCGPCIETGLPKLHEAIPKISDLPVNFISISIDDMEEFTKWKQFVTKFEFPGINVFDRDKFLRSYFKVQLIPAWIIINPEGKIVDRDAYDSDKPLAEYIRDIVEKGK